MADRDLWIRIKADAGSLITGLSKASAAVRSFDKDLEKNAAKRQALDDLGRSYRNIALGAAVGIAAVVKTAMDWESAWAGVSKTVDGNAEQMAKLEEQLRSMARTMPATHQEIAATAQAAGALGVATDDIAGFTKTMVMLGEATDDLTAEQAATGMQRFMNVMQTAPDEVDNVANALVRLGNNGASTEGQILDMAQNISGAAKTVRLSEADVLGLANALSSVGIDAEAGGSSVSKILIDMAKAAKTGSPDLERFASASGMTADGFSDLMEHDPAQAFNVFTKGLGKINDQGGDVFTLLQDLGQSDVRVTRALLGMAGAGDILKDSLADSADAMATGNDATDEYAKRAATAASQAKIAWNGIKDDLIDVGADALPVVKDLSQAVSDLTGMFSDLPAPVQGGVLKVLALTAALAGGMYVVTKARTGFAGLAESFETSGKAAEGAGRKYAVLRGGATLAGIGLLSFSDALDEVDEGLGTTATVLGSAAIGFGVAGPWGLAVGAGIGLLQSFRDGSKKTREEIAALATAFDQATGKMNETIARQEVIKELGAKPLVEGGDINALKGAKAIGIDLTVLTDAALGSGEALSQIRDRLGEIERMSPDQFRAAADTMGISVADLADIQVGLGDLLNDNADKWRQAGENARLAAEAQSGSIETTKRFRAALEGIPPAVVTELETLGYEASAVEIDTLTRKYNLTPAQVQTILAALDRANPLINSVRDNMDRLNGKVSTVTIKTLKESYTVPRKSDPKPSLKDMLSPAIGGVIDYYARGGIRENHVAQIAPAGAWRVWAEDETGGEGYIPLAPGPKRKRALEVHAEVGRRIGAVGYANGDVTGGSARSGGMSATLAPGSKARLVGPDLIEFVDARVDLVYAANSSHDSRNGK